MKRSMALGLVCSLVSPTACASPTTPGASIPSKNATVRAITSNCGARSRSTHGTLPNSGQGHSVPPGFSIQTIAQVNGARELAALPNGDLLVGTEGSTVYIVPNAEAASGKRVGTPQVFATLNDQQAAGVAFAPERCKIAFATTNAVWITPYQGGDLTAEHIVRIARVRTGPIAPHSDGDVHTTTSVTFASGLVYISVGSSCNACTEVDPTRAAVLTTHPRGGVKSKRATKIRNAIAIFTDPQSRHVWVGDAGQDDLPFGHPYEFIDDLSAHAGVADYGWPECEENHHAYTPGADCRHTVEPIVELPAYSTIIGAAFYPLSPTGRYAFPSAYRGGIFASAHGSWHTAPNGNSAASAQVVFIPMKGDVPVKRVDWHDPKTQWRQFVGGFQLAGTSRNGRPTGIAVGAEGSLFVADDTNGVIYRVRPR